MDYFFLWLSTHKWKFYSDVISNIFTKHVQNLTSWNSKNNEVTTLIALRSLCQLLSTHKWKFYWTAITSTLHKTHVEVQSWGSWNFKIDEVRIFVTLLIGTSLTIKNYHLNDTHKTEPTHIIARTRMSLHWRNIHTWLVTKYQTFKFEEDTTLVDTLSTRTSHTLHNICLNDTHMAKSPQLCAHYVLYLVSPQCINTIQIVLADIAWFVWLCVFLSCSKINIRAYIYSNCTKILMTNQ
jgi:hypothetical protein